MQTNYAFRCRGPKHWFLSKTNPLALPASAEFEKRTRGTQCAPFALKQHRRERLQGRASKQYRPGGNIVHQLAQSVSSLSVALLHEGDECIPELATCRVTNMKDFTGLMSR